MSVIDEVARNAYRDGLNDGRQEVLAEIAAILVQYQREHPPYAGALNTINLLKQYVHDNTIVNGDPE